MFNKLLKYLHVRQNRQTSSKEAAFDDASHDGELDGLIASLLKDGNGATFTQLFSLMQHIERETVIDQFFRVPFYYWKSRLDGDTRKRLLSILRDVHQGQTLALDERIVFTGLVMRLMRPEAEEREAFAKNVAELDDISNLKGDILFECIVLLFAETNHDALKRVTGLALSRSDSPVWQTELYADLHFQASYQLTAGRIFHNTLDTSDIENLQAAYALCATHLPQGNQHLPHYQAVIACVEKRLEDAISLHNQNRLDDGYFSQYFRAAANMMTLDKMRTLSEETRALDDYVIFDMRHKTQAEATLISCNEGYYHMYMDGFAESFAIHNRGGVLHVHAIDFDPPAEHIEALEAKHGIKVNVTRDATDLLALTPDLMKGYCAGARYMYLPHYLAHYKRVIVTDIDGVLRTSQQNVWHEREGRILLSTLAMEPDRKGHFIFWSNIGAGAAGIPATEKGLQFARAISNYLHARFETCCETGERLFFSDQVGLLLALIALDDGESFARMPQLFDQSGSNKTVGRDQEKQAAQKKLLASMRGV